MLAPPLGSRVLCHQLDPTRAVCRVGAADPGAREGTNNSCWRCQSGEKMSPGHGWKNQALKSKWLVLGRWLKVSRWDLQYRPGTVHVKSCRAQPNPTENWEKKLCLCPLSLRSFFFSFYFPDICSFFPGKRYPARTFFFLFFMVRNKILLALKAASRACQQKSALQQAG